jgi:hypothetical protein
MVDFNTYTQLHSDSAAFKRKYPHGNDPVTQRMDLSVMEADDPPPSPEIYAFPNTIVGYNLRSKKWGVYICSSFDEAQTDDV